MSFSTTSRPSRIPVIVASNNLPSAKISCDGSSLAPSAAASAVCRLCAETWVRVLTTSTAPISKRRRETRAVNELRSRKRTRKTMTATIRYTLRLDISRPFGARSHATDETIADAHHGFNAIAALIELLPEPADVNVERARVAVVAVAPNAVEQLLPRDNSISAACED